jgi:hypothetical protein
LKGLGGVRLDTRQGRHGGGILIDTAGSVASGFAGDPSSHAAVGLTLRGTIPLNDRSVVLSTRTMVVEALSDAEIPFEELATPGGAEGLRGSPRGRLRGASSVVATLEYRWLIHPRLDAALFVDDGGAFGPRFAGIRRDRLHPSVGFSLLGWGQETGEDELDGGMSLAWSPDDGLHLLLTVIE